MDHVYHVFYSFLYAAGGDWRNTFYIDCLSCQESVSCNTGHLLVADRDGNPLLIPVWLFEKLTGEVVDKKECIGIICREDFESFYHLWLLWHTETKQKCSVQQVLKNMWGSNMQG